jgi:tRNA-splicing ligase RtcB
METHYIHENVPGGVPLKMWTRGVPVEDEAKRQLTNAARLPIVFRHIAAMPDVHFGIGATVGSVIPTLKAIIPAAVGVDIGCGMMAAKTTLAAVDLPDNLAPLRAAIERAVPHAARWARPGRVGKVRDRWGSAWSNWADQRAHPRLPQAGETTTASTRHAGHRQPLHRGLPRREAGWVRLHSGSRGASDRHVFIELANGTRCATAPAADRDLAY